MDRNLVKISRLLTILHSALDATDFTWKILNMSCSEVHNLLKEWELPDDYSALDEKVMVCSCNKLPQNDEPVEMASDIDQLLEKAKTTRERTLHKWQSNKQNKLSLSNGAKSSASMDSQPKKGTNFQSRNHVSSNLKIPKFPNSSGPKHTEDSTRPRTAPGSVVSRSSVVSREKATKIKKLPIQTTYQRDFAARNSMKQNIAFQTIRKKPESNGDFLDSRSKEVLSKVVADVGNPMKVTIRKKPESKGESLDSRSKEVLPKVRADFGDQMKLMPLNGSDLTLPNSTDNMYHNNVCAVHNPAKLERKFKKTVTLQEAVDVLGVPSELLKPLKAYHQYLSQNEDVLYLGSSKGQSSRNKFVQKLVQTNAHSWKGAVSEPLVELYKDYTSVLQGVYSNVNGNGQSTINDLQEKMDALESAFQRTANFDISPHLEKPIIDEKEHPQCALDENIESREWALTGIWNSECKALFSGLKHVLNIRYRSKKDCKLFQHQLQKIQKLQLQIDILEAMKDEILPQLKEIEYKSPEFLKFYKMCITLCNIDKLVIPILVKM